MSNAPPKPTVTLDMKGKVCPHPLVAASQLLSDMAEGEILLLKSDCPGTRDDLFTWTRLFGHEIVYMGPNLADMMEYYLRRGRAGGIKPDVTLDVCGLTCPGPVIEARKILAGLSEGQVMQLISSCPAAREEVETWCQSTGNTLLSARQIAPQTWSFHVRKG